ncbi:MAG: HAMP domain-containing sensor histidine kinase [Bacteroidia bacterium]|nr:HAMP domain-containing sensor histidine kinase [Bacteroidia bacterium]
MRAIRIIGLFLLFFPISLLSIAQTTEIESLRQNIASTTTPNDSLDHSLTLAQKLRPFSTDSVRKYAEIALKLAEQTEDKVGQAKAYRHLSWSRGLMVQNIAQLIQDATQALELAKSAADSLEIHMAGLALSRGFLAIQKMPEAESFVKGALDYGQRNNLGKLVNQSYNSFAYLSILSDLNKSLEYRDLAIQQSLKNGDQHDLAFNYTQKAYILKFQKSDSVAHYLQLAREIYKQSPAPVYEGILLYNLAEYYGDLGYGDSLIYYGLKANDLSRQTNYVQVARVSKALLFAYYFNRQEYESAEPFARGALEIEKSRPSINYVSAFVDMARIQASLGRTDSARYYFKASEEALKVIPSPRFEVLVRSYYGEFLNNQKEYQAALGELTKANEISQGMQESAVQDFLLLKLADSHRNLRQYQQAKNYYREAIELGNTSNEADLLRDGYEGLKACDSALGNWASAFQNQQNYKIWADSFQRRSYNIQTAEMQTRFETVQKEAQITQLEQEQEIQNLELQQTETERNSLIGIVALLLIAGGIVFALLMQLRTRNTEIKAQREKLSVLNESKDRLFAMIAHDLRGPITGFQSVGKIFDHYVQKEDFSKLGAISQRINQQSNQLKQLLDNLLNWSLQQLGVYEAQASDIKLQGLGKEILDRYEAHAQAKGNELILSIPEELKWKGDKNGLSVVLNNLVGNAIKFTEQGQIELSARQNDGIVEISLSDTGKGMSPGQVQQLIKESKLSSERGTAGEKGTGLGFQIIHQLLDHWKGELKIESEEGKGSRFSIHLPIAPDFAKLST